MTLWVVVLQRVINPSPPKFTIDMCWEEGEVQSVLVNINVEISLSLITLEFDQEIQWNQWNSSQLMKILEKE